MNIHETVAEEAPAIPEERKKCRCTNPHHLGNH